MGNSEEKGENGEKEEMRKPGPRQRAGRTRGHAEFPDSEIGFWDQSYNSSGAIGGLFPFRIRFLMRFGAGGEQGGLRQRFREAQREFETCPFWSSHSLEEGFA